MIKLEANYDEGKDVVHVDYDSKLSNSLEHLYAIKCLMAQILKNDPSGMTVDEICRYIKNSFIDDMKAEKEKMKEEKKNGKRNSKSKADSKSKA